MPALVPPDVRFHSSFTEAVAEGLGVYLFRGEALELQDPDVFAGYVAGLLVDRRPETPRPPGYVPGTTLWWVDGDRYLGRVAIRHRLTEHLRTVGGHIGYEIRPSARRLGHATAALRAALPVAAGLGLDPALLTCDVDNVASKKVIESAGGVFDDRIGDKLRYWVPTTPAPAAAPWPGLRTDAGQDTVLGTG